jgi:plastocyanin
MYIMNNNIVSLLVAAILASSLFGIALAGTSDVLAQGSATGTTVSMAQGSQSVDNPEYYVPAQTTVKAGETVTWKNDDTAVHTATSGKDATPDGKFDTSLVSPGQSSKPMTMPNEPSQYPYFCTLHPWMVGTITVS